MNYKYTIAYLGQNKYRDYKESGRFIINPVDPGDKNKWDVAALRSYVHGFEIMDTHLNIASAGGECPGYYFLYIKNNGTETYFTMAKQDSNCRSLNTTHGQTIPVFDKKTRAMIYVHTNDWDFDVLEEKILKYLEESLW